MKKDVNWVKVFLICLGISILFVAIYQAEESRIESLAEALFIIACCTLSFCMWYGFGVFICNYAKKQNAGENGSQYNSSGREPRRIVATAIADVQYKTKVKTNYPKAFIMSALGRRLYGHVGGILGAASGSRMVTIPKKVLFTVLYSDGTRRREKVKYGSMRYKVLMQFLEE